MIAARMLLYTKPIAIDCAYASLAAYSDAPEVAGYKTVSIIEDDEVFAFICETDSHSIVAWRGTDDFKDAVTDLRYVKKDWRFGRVHKGFANSFLSIHSQVKAKIPKDKPYIVTGHSLGGASATLEASLGSAQAAYVFGCPRVGNGDFAIQCPLWRHEKAHDVVTFAPPRTSFVQAFHAIAKGRMPTLYRHIGTSIKVDGFGHGMTGYLEGVKDLPD